MFEGHDPYLVALSVVIAIRVVTPALASPRESAARRA